MNDTTHNQQVEVWEDDEDSSPLVKQEKVTDKDILKLGKSILLVCAIMFVIIAGVVMIFPTENTMEVWDFSKVALNSIVSVIIGLYFGNKNQT